MLSWRCSLQGVRALNDQKGMWPPQRISGGVEEELTRTGSTQSLPTWQLCLGLWWKSGQNSKHWPGAAFQTSSRIFIQTWRVQATSVRFPCSNPFRPASLMSIRHFLFESHPSPLLALPYWNKTVRKGRNTVFPTFHSLCFQKGTNRFVRFCSLKKVILRSFSIPGG